MDIQELDKGKFSKAMYIGIYRLAFPELYESSWKRWLKLHPEKKKESDKRFYWKHREARLAHNRKWYLDNLEYARNKSLEWSRNNPGKSRSIIARYKTKKKNATQGDVSAIERIYKRAAEFRKWFKVQVDHIIPISKGGSHSPENLQIIYAEENARKSGKLDYGQPQVVFI